jgi:hypothetical protein
MRQNREGRIGNGAAFSMSLVHVNVRPSIRTPIPASKVRRNKPIAYPVS